MKSKRLAAVIAIALALSVTACSGQASASTIGTQNSNDTTISTQAQDTQSATRTQDTQGGADASSKATQKPPAGAPSDQGEASQAPDAGSKATPSNPSLSPEISGQQGNVQINTKKESDIFTERDYSADYTNAVTINLKNNGTTVSGNGATVSGNKVTITAEGTYVVKGTLTDGQIAVNAPDTAKVQIVLAGADITSSNSAALYVKQADKVFVTLAQGTTNTLKTSGTYSDSSDTSIDGAVYSRDDITFNGTGTLNAVSTKGHAIVANDDLKIASGTFSLTGAKKGFNVNDQFAMAGGTVTIKAGSEGIEAVDISIFDGKIDITSSDDGLNAVESQDGSMAAAVYIYGGDVHINANGDGLDSNGLLYVGGGNISIDGPVANDNGALDHSGGAVTGGTVVAVGSAGMPQNFGSSSTQGSILANAQSVQSAGTKISLLDQSGNEIVSYTPQKEFQSVVISSPEIVKGSTYTLKIGSETQTITMDSVLYGQGFGPGAGGRGQKPGGFFKRP